MKKMLAGIVVLLLSSNARALPIIDSFTTGAIFPAFQGPTTSGAVQDPVPLYGSYVNPMSAPGCWGGMRAWTLATVILGPVDNTSLTIAGGQASYANSTSMQGRMRLGYGSYASVGLDGDWTGVHGLIVRVLATDTLYTRITAEINTLAGVAIIPSAGGVLVNAAGEYELAFASFTGGVGSVNLAHVYGVQFTFSTESSVGASPGADIILGNGGLMLTPEPATMTLLGLGVLALVRRRRKS